MTVLNNKFFSNSMSGASVVEVLLALAIVGMATPFVYNQIAQTNHTIHDIAVSRRIISSRDGVLNFVRMNQDKWPDIVQIQLTPEELSSISPDAVAGFIDKYAINGAMVTDVYLAFSSNDNELRTNKIARHIGGDAAVVGADGVAYGSTWAVMAPDFVTGDLIYRISREFSGQDTSRFLHRATSGEDNLNVMERDLNMAYHNVYNVATLSGKSLRARNANVTFVEAPNLSARSVYFKSGANMDGQDVSIGNIRVSGDVSGFRNVFADNINGRGFTTTGHIIADRIKILGDINIGNKFVLKSDSTRTISGFTGISASSVVTPFVSADEMMFYNNFGLTVSGELLMSTTPPLKLGAWTFPSNRPPAFSEFNLSRAKLPDAPVVSEFDSLMRDGWQGTIQPQIFTIN